MDGEGQRRRRGVEPRGFPPRAGTGAPGAWRLLAGWLFGIRADIEQEGLLAERTLFRPVEAPRPRDARPGRPGRRAGDER